MIFWSGCYTKLPSGTMLTFWRTFSMGRSWSMCLNHISNSPNSFIALSKIPQFFFLNFAIFQVPQLMRLVGSKPGSCGSNNRVLDVSSHSCPGSLVVFYLLIPIPIMLNTINLADQVFLRPVQTSTRLAGLAGRVEHLCILPQNMGTWSTPRY